MLRRKEDVKIKILENKKNPKMKLAKQKSTFFKDLDGLKYRNLNKEFKSYKNE